MTLSIGRPTLHGENRIRKTVEFQRPAIQLGTLTIAFPEPVRLQLLDAISRDRLVHLLVERRGLQPVDIDDGEIVVHGVDPAGVDVLELQVEGYRPITVNVSTIAAEQGAEATIYLEPAGDGE